MQPRTKLPKEINHLNGVREWIAQGDRLTDALQLASDFLPERKWCRELNKQNCNVFDVLTRVTLWNNRAIETEIEDLLTDKVPCSWEVVEDFSDANKPFSNREIPMQWINANHREGKWCRAITTYKFEMPTAGVHRVWLRKLILQKYVYVAYGFYQVSVPLLLFRQLRSIGCFMEHCFYCKRQGGGEVKSLGIVLDAIEEKKSRIHIMTGETGKKRSKAVRRITVVRSKVIRRIWARRRAEQSSPTQKRRRLVGKQAPPEVWN